MRHWEVITSGRASDLTWVLVAIGGFVTIVLLMRWAFSPGRSLVARQVRAGDPGDYGLLTPIATPATYIEGEQLRLLLEGAGIRATLTTTTAGPRLLVFGDDVTIARALIEAGPPPSDRPR